MFCARAPTLLAAEKPRVICYAGYSLIRANRCPELFKLADESGLVCRLSVDGMEARGLQRESVRLSACVGVQVHPGLTSWAFSVVHFDRAVAVLPSIPLDQYQGGPPPLDLSSRPERSAAEGPAVPPSAEANVPWANHLQVPFYIKANRWSLRCAPRILLSDLVASANFMRLSLKKAAYVAVGGCSV